jgi:hypothetical protein
MNILALVCYVGIATVFVLVVFYLMGMFRK